MVPLPFVLKWQNSSLRRLTRVRVATMQHRNSTLWNLHQPLPPSAKTPLCACHTILQPEVMGMSRSTQLTPIWLSVLWSSAAFG